MPRTKRPEERRADLLAAARAAFIAKGVTATTLEDITTGAGVSKGLFWQYFRSKEDVVRALQAQYSQRFADAVTEAVRAVPDWGEKLDVCVRTCAEHFLAELDLHDVLFRHGGHGHTDEDPAHAVFVDAIAALLIEGVTAGAYHVEEPRHLAALLYATLHAFDPTFQRGVRPVDLVPEAQRLFRRAAGLVERGQTDPPTGR